MPDYGIIQPAIMACAEERLGEVLDHFPNQAEARSAKLWLKMATEFAIARAKTVQSIHWLSAPQQTRFEVATALEHQGNLIVGYLKKFKQYWNQAIDGIDDIEEFLRCCYRKASPTLPVPDYVGEDAKIYYSIRRQELGQSIYFLGELEKEFNQKLLRERCFKAQ